MAGLKVVAADVAGQVADPQNAGGATVHVDGTNGLLVDGATLISADTGCPSPAAQADVGQSGQFC